MNDDPILNNLISELKRGTQVLAVLGQLHQGQYGYSLLQELLAKGIQIEAGTLYPLLRRLESQGLLTSQWDTSETRPRKYYVLSEAGIQIYTALVKEWQSLIETMTSILKEQ